MAQIGITLSGGRWVGKTRVLGAKGPALMSAVLPVKDPGAYAQTLEQSAIAQAVSQLFSPTVLGGFPLKVGAVGSNQSQFASSISSTAITTQAIGSTLVAFVSHANSATDPTSVTDNFGNTYTQKGKSTYNAATAANWVYVCENGLGGAAHAVTAAFGASGSISASLVEVKGGASVEVVASAAYNTTNTTIATPNMTTAGAGLLLSFVSGVNSSNYTSVTDSFGNVLVSQLNGATLGQEFAIGTSVTSAGGTYADSFTFNAGVNGGALGIALKPVVMYTQYGPYLFSGATSPNLSSGTINYIAGQPIIVEAGLGSVLTISDTAALSWTQFAFSTGYSGTEKVYAWYAIPSSSGSTVITINQGAANAYFSYGVTVFTANAGAPINPTYFNAGPTSAATHYSTSITPSKVGSTVWTYNYSGNSPATPTPDAGTSVISANFNAGWSGYYKLAPTAGPVASTAPVTIGWTTTADSQYVNSITYEVPTTVGTSGGTGGQTLLAPLLSDGDTLYAPTVVPGDTSIAPSLLTNASTLYAPTVAAGAVTLAPSLLSDGDTLYAPTVAPGAATLTPPLLGSSNVLYAPTVAAGAVSIAPPLLSNAQTFYGPTVALGGGATQTLSPTLLTNANTLYGPTVQPGTATLAPSLLASTTALYSPSVQPGAVQVLPPLLIDGDVIYAASVALGGVALLPPLLANSQSFYAPTVTPGAVSLAPSLLTNAQTFYGPVVTSGSSTLVPPLLVNANTLYAPTMAPGAVSVTAPLFTNAATLYAPTVSKGAVSLTPPLLTNTSVFYGPSVVPGATTLTASLVPSAAALYAPSVQGFNAVTAPLFTNGNTLFAPTVAPGLVVLSPSLLDTVSVLFAPVVQGGKPAQTYPLAGVTQSYPVTGTEHYPLEAVTQTYPLG